MLAQFCYVCIVGYVAERAGRPSQVYVGRQTGDSGVPRELYKVKAEIIDLYTYAGSIAVSLRRFQNLLRVAADCSWGVCVGPTVFSRDDPRHSQTRSQRNRGRDD